ncbi:enoyl-CoA hydratase/isomerase family protein [Mycobacterium sp.]|uniref:enoyl-CoA hydratase/isomerase family protein n=1 Tax=Mycobacterium sp. TaxID=1785 RepID=UPI00333FA740|nr:Enoyl-CoA hydratase / carnithine racemase [Mycobacterium sp.]
MSIRTEIVDAALVVTIDRPQVRNALDLGALAELQEVLDTVEDRPDVAGVVLTGNGAFCSGAELQSLVARAAGSESARRGSVEHRAQGLIRRLVALEVPTVAAIDGPAVGMGFDIALACDSRLIGADGWCMQGWGRVGLVGGTGGDLMLRLLNPSIVWKLLEEQPRIDGARAERWGLGETVAEGTARDAAVRRISKLALLPRHALASYVSFHRHALREHLDAHLTRCARIQAELLGDPGFGAKVARLVGSKKGAS